MRPTLVSPPTKPRSGHLVRDSLALKTPSDPKNAVPSACSAGRLPGQRRPDARPVAGQVEVVQGDDDHLRDAGKYQLETSEGFTAFMSEIGVNWFTRQIACALYPTATNKNLGGNRVGIDTSSTFKSTSIEFEFGVPFDETTGDGTEVRTTATLSGNSLIKDQRAVKSSGVSRIETRNFKNNGQIMELVHTIPGKANIRSVRVYKKL